MDSDGAPITPPAGEDRSAALADEVRQLRRLLLDLQDALSPAVHSSLRERSDSIQRLGGELAEREDELRRLRLELEQAVVRSGELEAEAARWREAAHRGVEEVAERAKAAVERFAQETAELTRALAAVREQLDASRAQTRGIAQARDAAVQEAERRKTRVRQLKARVIAREARRVQMTRSWSWRLTAPLRWLPLFVHRTLLETARMRRRMFGR